MSHSALPPAFSLRPILLASVLCLASSSVFAQAAGGDYTADLPTVDRVKAEIKGSDPTDTLARQVAVFTYLVSYIDRIKSNRDYAGNFTPGEQRMFDAYRLAAYQLSQDYAKSHTPAEATAFERLHGQYEMNSQFYKDWSTRLIGKQSTAAYKNAETQLGATQRAHIEKEQEQYRKQSAEQQSAATGLSNDPTAVATRRCLELGGNSVGCMGKGFTSGLMDMIGFHTEDLTGPGRAGVVLSGLYKNPSTTATLGFGADTVDLAGCGKLVSDPHGYTIDKQPGALRVTVDNEPHPIVLTMRPDGGFTGPGLIDVKGKIIIGYHTVTTTQMINGYQAAPDQCNGPCQTSAQVPDYAPAMGRCTIGSLSPPPAPKPAAAQPANESGLMGMLTGIVSTMSPGNGEVGLRMSGQYNGGMLLLDFSGNSLILDCGLAHVRQPYTVENTPNALLVHVQNPGGPFTLALEPDNSLRGSGSTTVNGRLVTGMNGENVTFAPRSERCDISTLRPKSGAPQATTVATAAPVPPSAVAAPLPSASPMSSISSPSAGGAGMTLAISSSFPIAKNPLAGQNVALMSERYDLALRKVGVKIPPDVTPGKALAAYMANCGPPKSCPPLALAMHPYFVGKGTFDSTGKVIVTAPIQPGSYYVFCSAAGTSGALVWDVPVTLNPGDNSIVLTATNAELVH